MIVLAIDPGPEHSGIVLYDSDEHKVLKSDAEISNYAIGDWIRDVRAGHLAHPTFNELVIEDIESYGLAVGATVFTTCKWIGRFMEAWWGDADPVHRQAKLIPRRDVKLNLCGGNTYEDPMVGTRKKVGKARVRGAVIERFPGIGGGKRPVIGIKKNPGPLFGVKDHAWDALALAITYVDNSRGNQ